MAEKKKKEEVVPFMGRRMPAILDEMDRLFGRFFSRGLGPSWWPDLRWPEEMEVTYPTVDIFEDASNVIVKAELPGVKKQELNVEISDNRITISGEKKKEEKVERKDYYRVERSSGSFTRSFALPTEVQSAKARASFKDGVLEIKVPKTAAAKKKEVKVMVE
jgi:HSP20 family protein